MSKFRKDVQYESVVSGQLEYGNYRNAICASVSSRFGVFGILNSLLENPDTAESARAFIEASENLKK